MTTWTDKENLGNGITVYRNVIKPELDIINRLENVLGEPAPWGELSKDGSRYHWLPAYVGYQQLMPDYRDCYDFKFKKTDIEQDPSQESLLLQQIWQDVYDVQAPAVEDYRRDYNIMPLKYWEAFNFIKYGPGQHFKEHHDHGFSYNCTVSLVAYINDDYDGGELYFRLQNLNIKPKAGDLYIFPSNFMYPHQAMPVHAGTKYSIVTMLDYSKKYHTPDMYDPKWADE
ncbi:2OG-Fe(II) oxygenase [bacterium]|nr:2OG-Fe(II) oxygenase [bacterium]